MKCTLLLLLCAVLLLGCDPGGEGSTDGGLIGGDGDGNGDGSGDTGRFANVPALPACDGPTPEPLTDGLDGRSLAMDGDTLVVGTREGIYTVPKDGSAAAIEIEGTGLSPSVAVFGGFVYSSDAVAFHVNALPGTTGEPPVSQDQLSGIRGMRAVSDGIELYLGSNDYGCTGEVHAFTLDGAHRVLQAGCVKAIAAREGTIYVLDEREDGATPAILRAAPGAESFEVLLEERGLDTPLTVSDEYVYFTIAGRTLGNSYLVRRPIAGGELQGLAGPNYFDNLATDGQQVFFHTAFIPDICTFGFDEASRAIVSVASDGEVNAWDDDYLYAMQGFVGGAASRVPR